MAKILHTFTVNDPNNVGPWPPSVQASEWLSNLTAYASVNSWQSNSLGNITVYIWDDETALNTYLNAYRLTDATLLADLNAWKAAHNITFSTVYYNLSNSSITTPDIVS